MTEALDVEREHQDAWYARAIRERFFEREGFRQLVAWNLQCLRRAVPLGRTTRVLSLGCGTGEYELALAPEVGHLLAVDLSAIAITEAQRRVQEAGLSNVAFEQASLDDLQLPAGSYDIVYALGVLHHLSADERATLLTRARAWLAPGGRFYARDPNARGLLRRAAGWSFRHSSFHSPNEAALDPDAMCTELRTAGFRDPRVSYTDVLGGPLPWLLPARSALLWRTIFAVDRAWLATPGLRGLASQFDINAKTET